MYECVPLKYVDEVQAKQILVGEKEDGDVKRREDLTVACSCLAIVLSSARLESGMGPASPLRTEHVVAYASPSHLHVSPRKDLRHHFNDTP